MPRKPEQYSEPSFHSRALSAVAQYIQTIAGTWDTCSPSLKAETLHSMAQLTEAVIEVLAVSLEPKQHTPSERTSDNGEI